MSKYIIRITNDDAPAPIYYQCIRAGRAAMTDRAGFAKRYTEEELPLAEEMLKKLRSQATERDGETSTFEIVNAATGLPPGEDQEQQTDPWETRFIFQQTATGAKSEFQMCKTAAGIRCRYVTFAGDVSDERPREEIDKCFVAWTDCIRAWVHAKTTGASK